MEQIQLEDTCARAKMLGGKIAIANVGFFFSFFFNWECSGPCSKLSSVTYLHSLCVYGFIICVGSGLSQGVCKSDFWRWFKSDSAFEILF